MVAAEGMRAIYLALLRRMEKDRFRLFDKTYRLNHFEKATIMLGQIASKSLQVGWRKVKASGKAQRAWASGLCFPGVDSQGSNWSSLTSCA